MPDYYALLGVPRNASDSDINASFRLFSRVWHPDVNKRPDAAERFKELSQARDVLLDPAARAEHDRLLDGGAVDANNGAGFPSKAARRTPAVIHVTPESIDFGLLRSGGSAAQAEVLLSWEGPEPYPITAQPQVGEWWELLDFDERGDNVTALRMLARAPAGMVGGRRTARVEIQVGEAVFGVELMMTVRRAPSTTPTANENWVPVDRYVRRSRFRPGYVALGVLVLIFLAFFMPL